MFARYFMLTTQRQFTLRLFKKKTKINTEIMANIEQTAASGPRSEDAGEQSRICFATHSRRVPNKVVDRTENIVILAA
jgi:hypothetical protein